MAGRDQSTHENFSRDEEIVVGSDRTFGLVMAGAFAVVSALNVWHAGRIWPWTATLASIFVVAALLRPALLNPLNRIWMKFGLLLHKVVNPVIMALLFYGTVLPTGLIMRAHGQGPAAAEARAGRRQLLDRARPAGARARDDERSVLESTRWIF